MKAASISEIKQELNNVPAKELINLCLKMAKYKKENKELLSYLLFESSNIDEYISSVKNEINDSLDEVNRTNLYLVKKSLRKILRNTNKYIKYTSSQEVGVELLLYFCLAVKQRDFKMHKSVALLNLYNGQLKKIHGLIEEMHEDLRYDFTKRLSEVSL